jgi:hypothetical protein
MTCGAFLRFSVPLSLSNLCSLWLNFPLRVLRASALKIAPLTNLWPRCAPPRSMLDWKLGRWTFDVRVSWSPLDSVPGIA